VQKDRVSDQYLQQHHSHPMLAKTGVKVVPLFSLYSETSQICGYHTAISFLLVFPQYLSRKILCAYLLKKRRYGILKYF